MIRKTGLKKYDETQNNQLSFQRYLGLSVIIMLLLVLMFVITNLNVYMRQKKDVLESKEYLNLEQSHKTSVTQWKENYESFAVLTGDNEKIEDALVQAKTPYFVSDSIKTLPNTDSNLIIDGNMLKDQQDVDVVKQLIGKKKKIIFLNLPNKDFIEQYDLKKILGLSSVLRQSKQQELNLVPGFMLGGHHEFKEFPYSSTQVKLLYSTKVYGYSKDNSPVIWRNIYEGSEIYIVNGSFMDTNASYGVLSSLMAEIYEDYIYPVVNARLTIYEGFPYISDDNRENLEKLYNRDAMKFQNDILMQNLLTINNRRDFAPNGYLRLGFKKDREKDIDNYSINQVNNIKSQIYSSGGDVGLRYSKDHEFDKEVYEEIFKDQKLSSVLLSKDVKDMREVLGISENLESVLGPWKEKSTFKYLDENTVYIPFTVDGIKNGGREKFEFVSAVTAFGAIVQNLDVEDLVLNESEQENWTSISKEYIKFIDEYRERFEFLESRNITSASRAVKIFKKSSPKIIMAQNQIMLEFDEWFGTSEFILRTDKVIEKIIGGSFTKIEEGAYLITAREREVDITLNTVKNKTARR